MNKIEIYEFPIENDINLFMAKKNISYNISNIINPNLDKISFITDIMYAHTNNISKQVCMPTLFSKNVEHMSSNIKMEYLHKSCDPLQFTYNVQNISYTPAKNGKQSIDIENYEFSKKKFNDLYSKIITNLQLQETNMLQYIVEGLLLPELNYISCFTHETDNNKCDMMGLVTKNKQLRIISMTDQAFESTMTTFFNIIKKNIENNKNFVEEKIKYDEFIGSTDDQNIYAAPRVIYIQKKKLEGDVCLFGDIHGSLHTLLRSLLRLVAMNYIDTAFILKKTFHIVFLGDLIDRNIYGTDIIFIIMHLFILNPNNIHIVRGNHEEIQTNFRYSFNNEFLKMASRNIANNLYKQFCETWLYLPCAIYAYSDQKEFLQFCHGGFYSDAIFIKKFLQSDTEIQVITDENKKSDIQWADFHCGTICEEELNKMENTGIYGTVNPRRGLVYKVNESISYMNMVGIKTIIRGHQDLADNTKLVSSDRSKCLFKHDINTFPIEYSETKNLFVPTSINSFEIKLPKSSDIHKFEKKYGFPPIFTISTGTTSRFIDCDGFAILK